MEGAAGVYVTLEDLDALRGRASGASFLPRQPVTSVLRGRYAAKLRGRGLIFEELRQYRPGDDIRSIDWKATARTREPQVRVYAEERERPVWLLVDQRQGMFFGSQRALKSVVAAEAAALAVWRTLAVKDRVGAVIFGDDDAVALRPSRTEASARRLLAEVVRFNQRLSAKGPAAPGGLSRALQQAGQLVTHDGLVVVISDFAGGNEEDQHAFARIRQHNDMLAMLVFDPLERALPDGGLAVSDGEAQVRVDSDRRLQQAFAERQQQRQSKLKALFGQHDVPLLALSTAEPVEDQIRAQLGHAVQRRRS